jgi:hypothetical protein
MISGLVFPGDVELHQMNFHGHAFTLTHPPRQRNTNLARLLRVFPYSPS